MKRMIVVVALMMYVLGGRAEDRPQLRHEGIVEASVHDVWAAYTTKDGLESWMAAHADVELKIGGRMRTHYDPKGRLGDPQTIENAILSYEPNRMLSIKVSKVPAGFPFPKAVKSMWTVVYFDSLSPTQTRLREVSLGFKSDDESMKMRAFFDRGNAATLTLLQKHFARTSSGK